MMTTSTCLCTTFSTTHTRLPTTNSGASSWVRSRTATCAPSPSTALTAKSSFSAGCARARRVVSPSAFGTCFQHSLLVCLAVSGEELGIDRRYEFRVIGVSCLASLLRRVLKPVGEEGSPTKGTLFFSTPRVWALYFRQKQAQKGAQKTVLKKRACTVCVCVCVVFAGAGAPPPPKKSEQQRRRHSTAKHTRTRDDALQHDKTPPHCSGLNGVNIQIKSNGCGCAKRAQKLGRGRRATEKPTARAFVSALVFVVRTG